jgi:hypothetical protein
LNAQPGYMSSWSMLRARSIAQVAGARCKFSM